MALFDKALKDLVRELLEKHPALRDNDSRLLANVWSKELITKNIIPDIGYCSARDFLYALSDGDKLTPAETITRCRRKIQEEEPALQGEKRKKRKDRAEEIRMELASARGVSL